MLNLKKGFSTAEMLVTIAIFSLGMLPLIVLFQNSHKQTAQAKNLMIAQSIGRTKIAEIRAMGFETLRKEIENPSLDLTHQSLEVSGKLVDQDDNSIEYPEYYRRFKTTLNLDSDKKTVNGEEVIKKIRVELDVEWLEPNMRKMSDGQNFKLGFGTVVVNYDS
jgi:type II secretory pathway pseudopilin PulG